MKNLLVLFFSIGFLNVAYTQSEAVNPSSTYIIETKYVPSILDKVLANGKKIVEPEMVFVEGGTFQMGSSSGEADEQPVHFVTLSSFNIGKYEVTQALWMAVMGNNPSQWDCDNCPVNSVSWDYVQDFISKLNAQTGKNYRLPTEAEWEYAAKGGKQSRGYTYSGSNNLGSVAWYSENSWYKTQLQWNVHDVGVKQANELGIYDMSGNVLEWCYDWYDTFGSREKSKRKKRYNETNPTDASTGLYRVLRGGGYEDNPNNCRNVGRFRDWPVNGYRGYGFRLVLPVED